MFCTVFLLFFGQNIWNALTAERYTKCVIDDFTMAHTNIELVIDLWPLRSKGIQQITQHKKIYTRTYMKNRKWNSKFLCHNAYIFFLFIKFYFLLAAWYGKRYRKFYDLLSLRWLLYLEYFMRRIYMRCWVLLLLLLLLLLKYTGDR